MKENSKFNPVKLHLKIDLVRLVNTHKYESKYFIKNINKKKKKK